MRVNFTECVELWATSAGLDDDRDKVLNRLEEVKLSAICRLTIAVENIATRLCETISQRREREEEETRENEMEILSDERGRAIDEIRSILQDRLFGFPGVFQFKVIRAFGILEQWWDWPENGAKPDLAESLRMARELPFPKNPFKTNSKRAKMYEELLEKQAK